MDNYDFCVHWVKQQHRGNPRVLDYGCGAGRIVSLLRAERVDAFGCDVFYEGGDYSSQIMSGAKPFVRRMDGNVVPFESNTFDLVVSNQVFEHVPDLDACLAEISRVLKPTGKILAMFPDRSCLREGHCGVPLLHWFPKKSRSRVYYAAAWRLLGFGYHKNNKPVMQWSRDFCNWLDDWTHYRSAAEIRATFSRHLSPPDHIEDEWLAARSPALVTIFPKWSHKLAVRKLGHSVFSAVKTRSADESSGHQSAP